VQRFQTVLLPSARNLEVPVYVLKAKQGHTVRKIKKKGEWVYSSIYWYIILRAYLTVYLNYTALPHSLHCRCFFDSSFLSVRRDLLPVTKKKWRLPFSVQLRTNSFGRRCCFPYTSFCWRIMEKNTSPVLFLEKRSSGMVYRHIPTHFEYYYYVKLWARENN
jgi:hypothetical protein